MKAKKAHGSQHYDCAMCKKHFMRARNDLEAWEEYNENLSRGIGIVDPSEEEIKKDEVVILCDDCYQKMKKQYPWLA